MNKPTAAQVWRQIVDEAGEDEIDAVLSLSQDQVDAELAGAGFDVKAEKAKAERFLEDLVSGALDESLGFDAPPAAAAPAPASATVTVARSPELPAPWHRRRPRTALALLTAATAAAAASGTYVVTRQEPVAHPPPALESDRVAASEWRGKAFAACDAKDFEACLADLAIARALDPAGDEPPLVQRTRDRAIKGVLDRKR